MILSAYPAKRTVHMFTAGGAPSSASSPSSQALSSLVFPLCRLLPFLSESLQSLKRKDIKVKRTARAGSRQVALRLRIFVETDKW